jgi:hypothetical protein
MILPTSMGIEIGTQLGSHKIIALLGKGGMGEVVSRARYEAEARGCHQDSAGLTKSAP